MRGTCDCCQATAELESYPQNNETWNLCYFCANTHVACWAAYPASRPQHHIELLQELNLVANLLLDKLGVTPRDPNPACEVRK